MKAYLSLLSILFLLSGSCKKQQQENFALDHTSKSSPKLSHSKNRELSQEFKDYWYAGKAEITSYDLTQARYGELRSGTSINIFVTEDFLPETQVKADRSSDTNIPVMKLNNTKKFLTGIYPYSVMTSTFSPTTTTNHAVKISHSMQEWCGHVYAQLNNREKFEIKSHSYFEGEADSEENLDKNWLENEIWNLIRINPEELPTGEFKMLPAFEFSRMSHKELKAYQASGILLQGDSLSTYTITYPNLQRSLAIHFNSAFPFQIERWEETHPDGLQTKAVKKKRIRSAYWGQNSNKDVILRDSLGLK